MSATREDYLNALREFTAAAHALSRTWQEYGCAPACNYPPFMPDFDEACDAFAEWTGAEEGAGDPICPECGADLSDHSPEGNCPPTSAALRVAREDLRQWRDEARARGFTDPARRPRPPRREDYSRPKRRINLDDE